jgi:hypothetical protein
MDSVAVLLSELRSAVLQDLSVEEIGFGLESWFASAKQQISGGLSILVWAFPLSVAAARLGSALGAAQGVSRSAAAQLRLEPAPE